MCHSQDSLEPGDPARTPWACTGQSAKDWVAPATGEGQVADGAELWALTEWWCGNGPNWWGGYKLEKYPEWVCSRRETVSQQGPQGRSPNSGRQDSHTQQRLLAPLPGRAVLKAHLCLCSSDLCSLPSRSTGWAGYSSFPSWVMVQASQEPTRGGNMQTHFLTCPQAERKHQWFLFSEELWTTG